MLSFTLKNKVSNKIEYKKLYKGWQNPNTDFVSLYNWNWNFILTRSEQCTHFQLSLFYSHNDPSASNSILTPRGNCHSSFGAKCFDSTCPLWSVEDLMSRTVESCKGHLGLHSLHYCGRFVCEESVCLKRPLGWNTVPTPSTPYSPHPTIPMARPAVFFCVVRWQACVPREGHPPTCTPTLRYQAAFPSLFWCLPASVRTSLSDLRYLSRLSVDYEDPLARSLSVSSLHRVLFFSLVAFYSFKFFSSFQFVVFVLLVPCFLLFSVLPKLPSGTPVFPLKDAFQLSSPPLSLLMGRAGDDLLYLLIYLFGSGWGSSCMY